MSSEYIPELKALGRKAAQVMTGFLTTKLNHAITIRIGHTRAKKW
jgi:hypothetical protein